MKSIEDWSGLSHVLCVRLDALGDVLMTTPAMAALKTHTGGRLALLTSSAGAKIAPLLPMIDDTLVYDPPWMKATPPEANPGLDRSLIGQLSRRRFDAAVIFTVYSQSPLPAALACYLAGIPRRLAHCRENPYQLLTHWVAEPEPHELIRHEVQRQLDLVEAVGASSSDTALKLRFPAQAASSILAQLVADGLLLDEPWIVVHPGASAPSRRYPPEHFAATVRQLVAGSGYQVIFTGSAAEHALIESIRTTAAVDTWSLAGQTSLQELAALLARADLLVSNNTGPVHLAAAVGTPVVDLYALTNPQHGPWGVPHELLFHDVPCKNCYRSVCPQEHHDCLRLVAPEQVVAAACRLIRRRAASDVLFDSPLAPARS